MKKDETLRAAKEVAILRRGDSGASARKNVTNQTHSRPGCWINE